MVDVPAEIEQPSEGTAPSGNEAVAEENEGKILTIVYDAATGTIESATTSQDDMSTMSQEEKFKLAELELDLASKQVCRLFRFPFETLYLRGGTDPLDLMDSW